MTNEEYTLLERFAKFLNENPKAITLNQVNKVMKAGISRDEAVKALIKEYLDYDPLLERYYDNIVKKLNPNDYISNEYYSNIKIQTKKYAGWEIKMEKYDAYELFVYNDLKVIDGITIPQIGYFERPFSFPAAFQDKRMWMSITPNEINTMQNPIDLAHGTVLTFGLGLGYYADMVSNRNDVDTVTIIEKDPKIINLFNTFIFPFFKNKDKIEIIVDDAYKFIKKLPDGKYDYLFIDIHHDASDGMEVYNKMRKYTDKYIKTEADYWIIDTIKHYL